MKKHLTYLNNTIINHLSIRLRNTNVDLSSKLVLKFLFLKNKFLFELLLPG